MIKRGTGLKSIGAFGLIVNIFLILFSISELVTYKQTDAQIIKTEMKTFPMHVGRYSEVPVSVVRYKVDGREYEVTVTGDIEQDENGHTMIRYKPSDPSVFLDPTQERPVNSFNKVTGILSLLFLAAGWLLDREDGFGFFGNPVE